MRHLLWLLILPLFVACSNGDSASDGNLSIVFASSTLSTRAEDRVGTPCNVTSDIGGLNEAGRCYTPLQVSGYFNMASLSKTGGGAPVRILGGGSDSGIASVFKKAAFDLKTSPTIASSEDNIQDGGGTYDVLSLTVQALEVVFVAETPARYYHVRIPFTGTPPSSVTAFGSCGLTTSALAEADTLGSLFGSLEAQAGDILVCIKPASTDVCADTDFNWVNSSDNLQPTRPASPKQLTGSFLKTDDACTGGATRPEVTWGFASLDVMLSSPITVSAAISEGVKTYTSGGVSGTKALVSLDIATAESLFVPGTTSASDLASTSQSTILSGIDTILFKPVYIKNNKNSSTAGTGDLTATATVTITP